MLCRSNHQLSELVLICFEEIESKWLVKNSIATKPRVGEHINKECFGH